MSTQNTEQSKTASQIVADARKNIPEVTVVQAKEELNQGKVGLLLDVVAEAERILDDHHPRPGPLTNSWLGEVGAELSGLGGEVGDRRHWWLSYVAVWSALGGSSPSSRASDAPIRAASRGLARMIARPMASQIPTTSGNRL